MNDKQQTVASMGEVFNRWQELLTSLSEEQIADPQLPENWSIKNVVVHLWGWQQATVARAEAALHDRAPDYPGWWEAFGPDPEEDVDRVNAWFYQTYRDKPWPNVYADWRAQFRQCLELAREITERDMLEPGRYPWMGGYALSASFMGTYEHHQEHIETLLAWLREHGKIKPDR